MSQGRRDWVSEAFTELLLADARKWFEDQAGASRRDIRWHEIPALYRRAFEVDLRREHPERRPTLLEHYVS